MTKQVHIEKEQLEKYFAMHKTYDEMAKDFGCSAYTVMKHANAFGMRSDARKYQMMQDNPARKEAVKKKISDTVAQMWKDGYYEERVNGMAGITGEKHPSWKEDGGKSPYREKAKFYHPEAICHCCGKKLSWDDKSMEVHHVDGDHNNYILSNLQPLCHSCHRKYHRKGQHRVEITRRFTFEACHYLPYHDGKCKYLHGHSYVLEVSVKNVVLPETGMVMDFGKLKDIVNEKVVDVLDHSFFNDLIPYPTCEYMIMWIWRQLSQDVKGLSRLKLYETENSYCILDSKDMDFYLKQFESDWRKENKEENNEL